jgi:hypothetical protein
MTSYVQLIPPKASLTDNPVSASLRSLRNPWNQLGTYTLGQAAVYATQDQGFLDSLKASHHTENFTLTMTQPNPIVTVEVVAPTRANAQETTELIITRFRNFVQSLQKQAGAQDSDVIVTQRLDQGQNLVASRGKVKRALAALAAAGLLVMAGGALGFDALARRRSRRRQEGQETPAAANGTEPKPHAEPNDLAGEPKVRPPTVEDSIEQQTSSPGSEPATPRERTAIVVKRTASVVNWHPSLTSTRPREAATYVSMNAQGETNGESNGVVVPSMNGDAAASASDVGSVLQPKSIGGENGKKSE